MTNVSISLLRNLPDEIGYILQNLQGRWEMRMKCDFYSRCVQNKREQSVKIIYVLKDYSYQFPWKFELLNGCL